VNVGGLVTAMVLVKQMNKMAINNFLCGESRSGNNKHEVDVSTRRTAGAEIANGDKMDVMIARVIILNEFRRD
jgi:hypothetical protein